jgi:hypothetical protein
MKAYMSKPWPASTVCYDAERATDAIPAIAEAERILADAEPLGPIAPTDDAHLHLDASALRFVNLDANAALAEGLGWFIALDIKG